ncbi:MAG TPA: hypothetical protein VE842_14465 [Pyrinomonadaceae bacterium]|nr:hypothetical protein [Pyrinomonadaceae bacterium]
MARRILNTAAVAAAWLAATSCERALAQCAMCRAAAGNSVEASSMTGSMNLAVLVLIIPPVALFCSFIFLLYRYRKAPSEFLASDLVEGKAARRTGGLEQRDEGARGLNKGDDDDRSAALVKAI